MKKITQNLRWLVTLLAMIVCTGVWAEDVTVTFKAGVDKSSTTSISKEDVTINVTSGTFNRDDNYRCYANGTMTISSDYTISKIVINCTGNGTSNYGPGKFSNESYSYSGNDGTWTGEDKSISLNASAQVRMTSIVVTYSKSGKQNSQIAWSASEASATMGMDFVAPTLDNPNNLSVTYSSTNQDVATIASDGTVSIVGAGETTISAEFVGDDTYDAKTVSYTLTVTGTYKKANGYYALVTDASTLAEGDEIIFVYVDADKKVAMSTTQNQNNRSETSLADVTWSNSDEVVEISQDDVQALTLEKKNNNWLFNTGNGYLYAASSSSNYLRTEATADANAEAEISISGGNAAITFQGSASHNKLKYNSSSSLFSCYSSGQKDVKIYRKVVVVEGTLGAGKYATRIYPFAPKKIEGITFYSCAAADGNTLTLVPVETPEACVPYILGNDAEGATEAISIEQTGVDIHVNDTYEGGWLTGVFVPTPLEASTEVKNYVLQTQKDKNGVDKQSFYIVNQSDITVPAYRAYLTVPSDVAGGVKAFNLGGDDATAINALDALTSGAYEGIYTVDGVKLNRIEKGVNILKMADGTTRKVIVK